MAEENLVIHEMFSQSAKAFGKKTALQAKKDGLWKEYSYKELERRSLGMAVFLAQSGLKKGDCAGIILENCPEWVISFLGIMYAGLIAVPLDVQLAPEEIKNLIRDSGAKVLFCSREILDKKIDADLARQLPRVVVVGLKERESENFVNFEQALSQSAPAEKNILPVVEPTDTACLFYTSGTTGIPKGVLLTHKNICSNFLSIKKSNICNPSDNFVSILPLHHAYPLMVNLVVCLLMGGTLTFCPAGFKPQDLIGIIREKNGTMLVGVPQVFSLIRNSILERIKKIPAILRPVLRPFIKAEIRHNFGANLRLLVSGGARLDPKVVRDLTKLGLKVIEGFGLTETSPIATLTPPEKVKFGSVGKAIPDVQIKIHNPDSQGTGQILIKGPNVMKGYFRQEELTASVIKDGWFYSGDLGYLDKEGYLFITGREKDVIVLSSGKTIYPEDLEAYYSQSPYIKEICILEKQEEKFGMPVDFLYAVILPDLEYFRLKNEANIQAKIRWELENLGKPLPPYKHIMGFMLTKEELPKTTLKKIKRFEVKEKYLKVKPSRAEEQNFAFSDEDVRLLSEEPAKKIINYLANQLKRAVFLDSHLELDLGIDSLTRVELGLGLESIFSIKIPNGALYTVSTVREVILKISELRQEKILAQELPKSWQEILKREPKAEIIEKIRLKPRLIDYFLVFISKNLFLLILRVFWLLRIEGRENLPQEGPFIICPNHASYLDGFVVFSSLPFKLALKTYFIGINAIFELPVFSWAIKLARLIPIDPNIQLVEAMQAVFYVLSREKSACIFPEGQRSIDEKVSGFKKGVGILIKELDIPVVPVYIKGSHQSWPRSLRLPRFYPLKIIFGRPVSLKDLLKASTASAAEDYKTIADNLREEVLKLAC